MSDYIDYEHLAPPIEPAPLTVREHVALYGVALVVCALLPVVAVWSAWDAASDAMRRLPRPRIRSR